MQVQLKPWGNSQGIRFSREFLASAGIKPDDVQTARIEKGSIILSKQVVSGKRCVGEDLLLWTETNH